MKKKNEKFIVSDRYSALGIPRPNKAMVCRGRCEGTGWIPVKSDHSDKVLAALWKAAEKKKHAEDGYHFVKCPTCKGTGKKVVKKKK